MCEVLGLWPYGDCKYSPAGQQIADTEGAKFWLSVMNEFKNRGAQDVLIAGIDGSKGFPEAITSAFPTEVAATKLIYPAIRNFEKGGRNVREWYAARNQFDIKFDERFNARAYLKPVWARPVSQSS